MWDPCPQWPAALKDVQSAFGPQLLWSIPFVPSLRDNSFTMRQWVEFEKGPRRSATAVPAQGASLLRCDRGFLTLGGGAARSAEAPRPVHLAGLNCHMPICAPTESQTNAWLTAIVRMNRKREGRAVRVCFNNSGIGLLYIPPGHLSVHRGTSI